MGGILSFLGYIFDIIVYTIMCIQFIYYTVINWRKIKHFVLHKYLCLYLKFRINNYKNIVISVYYNIKI